MLDLDEASNAFAAIGSAPRLAIVLSLVRAGHRGLSTGAIQERVNIPASTLSHHIRFLSAAGLISQEKQGRTITCRATFDRIENLADFLLNECCLDAAPATGEEDLNGQS